MTHQDAETIVTIAALASMADGHQDPMELAAIGDAARRLGLPTADTALQEMTGRHAAGTLPPLSELTGQLSGSTARHTAYDVALAVCNVGAPTTPAEDDFLRALATALGVDASVSDTSASDAAARVAVQTLSAHAPVPTTASSASSVPLSAPELDSYILDQAMLTAALELLPDRLANLAILPLQMRLVRHIGSQYGQQMDANQVKDLVATFGLGAAAQVMESIVRKAFGGIAGGLLGGLLGGATGTAAGGAVTFASTYALGHAAQRYYAQDRSLSTADMKALFARFRGEAGTVYPRVQDRVSVLARGSSLTSIVRGITGR